MKTCIRVLGFSLVILSVIVIYSCERSQETGKGTAEFAISLPGGSDQLKSGMVDSGAVNSYQLMVSVQDLQGNPVFTDKLVPLYAFGTGFISEKVEIMAGEFQLTKFLVINPSGSVIYAAPVAGSPLAYLSIRPLPFNFNIYPDKVTQIVPEVLTVGDQTPDKFGYSSFSIQVIKPLAFWTGAVIDNPLIMAPFPLFTEARLTIFANDGWHFTFKLFAGLNQLVIRGGSERYVFLLEKDGYFPQKLEFSSAQLIAATRENPLYLMIPWDSTTYKTLVLQPGPEEGKDAMISNLEPDKNFGDYKYFEATFLPEPVLTVMRLNRSLIWFDLSQLPKSAVIRKIMLMLSYDIPVPWDSTMIGPVTSAPVGGVLQQVIEPWDETSVTWNKQPASIEANQVFISPFIRNANFIEVDVTKLFVSAMANPLPNYGMKFRLWPEDNWPGFRFASSDFLYPSMRPKLTIFYTLQ